MRATEGVRGGCRAAGRTGHTEGWSRMERGGVGAEGPDEREKRGERARRVEAKRASRLGLGVAAAAGGTKRREGEQGVVARRGARRRRERAAGGSIHPSAAFFSPCAARTTARLSAPRRSLGHVGFDLSRSPSSAEEAAIGFAAKNVL